MENTFVLDGSQSNLLSMKFSQTHQDELYKQIVLDFIRNGMKVPISETLKKDKSFILQAIQYPACFAQAGKFVSNYFDDEQFLLEMIKTNPNIIKYCPKNSKYCMEAIKHNPKTLEFATDDIKSSETIVWELFQKDPSCLKFASQDLKTGPFAFKILECNEEAFKKYCCDPFIIRPTDSRKYILKLVSYGPYFSQINLAYQNDEEIQLAALNHDASVWRLLRKELKNRSLVLHYAKRNRDILEYANEFLEEYELMLELIDHDVKCLKYFDQNMREKLYLQDKQVLVNALAKNDELKDMQDLKSTVWYCLTNSMLEDRDIVMIFFKQLCQYEIEKFKFDIDGERITLVRDTFKLILQNFKAEKELFQLNLFAIGLEKLYSYADPSIKNDPMVIANLFNAECSLKGIKFDKDILRELISILEHKVIDLFTDMAEKNIIDGPEIVFNDADLMILAIKKHEKCFTFASQDLKSNPEFIKNCLNTNPKLLNTIDLDLLQMDKELAIKCCNNLNGSNYENRIQKLKEFLEDEEVFTALASNIFFFTYEKMLEIFKRVRNYENLKQDYKFVCKMLNFNMGYSDFFDQALVKQAVMELVDKKPTSFFDLNNTMRSEIDIVVIAYRKAESKARMNWYIPSNKEFRLELLKKGVYCDDTSLDSYFLDSSFMLEHKKF